MADNSKKDEAHRASFDLIYVRSPEGKTMSCAVRDSVGDHLIGPFPANEAGPQIAEALLGFSELGLRDKNHAVSTYVAAHFENIIRGVNSAGISYPYYQEGKSPSTLFDYCKENPDSA